MKVKNWKSKTNQSAIPLSPRGGMYDAELQLFVMVNFGVFKLAHSLR